MQDLLQQQRRLERRKFINNLIDITHNYVLGTLGSSMAVISYDVNTIALLFSLGLIFYTFSLGMFVVVPFCINYRETIDKKLDKIKENIKQVEQIHESLNLLRDSMLFDRDERYWQILESLPVTFDE